jgi:hypothetical protein
METAEAIDTTAAAAFEGDSTSPEARDYEGEARSHGWTPKDEFKGDATRWVDAETFIKRADEVMPFLKKQNAALKRDIDDMKRQLRQASAHFGKAEERAYQRAVSELQAKHDQAVDEGDKVAANRVVAELRTLEKDFATTAPAAVPDDAPTPDQLRAELADWVASNDWYGADDTKTKYADMQAELMGPADQWPDGRKAWFAALEKRVADKFTARKAPITNGTGQPTPSGRGGKSFNDLPAEAKRMCDKWVKSGVIKSRDDYVRTYQWEA